MKIIKPSFEIMFMNDPDIIMENLERDGRTCYKSEERIAYESDPGWMVVSGTPPSGSRSISAGPFIRSIIKSGHHSVLEHESISVRFICDRGVMFELRTHRLASFSAESTRYCNYAKDGLTFIVPPWVDLPCGNYNDDNLTGQRMTRASWVWANHLLETERVYHDLVEFERWRPEQARSVLPNSLKTEIVMTANIREWRHVFALRCSKAAHPQMRELLTPLLEHLDGVLPVLFQDVLEGLK